MKKFVKNVDEDQYCEICYSEGLNAQPCVQLDGCKHVFHFNCISKIIKDRWLTPRITFAYLRCPAKDCRKPISFANCPELQTLVD